MVLVSSSITAIPLKGTSTVVIVKVSPLGSKSFSKRSVRLIEIFFSVIASSSKATGGSFMVIRTDVFTTNPLRSTALKDTINSPDSPCVTIPDNSPVKLLKLIHEGRFPPTVVAV